MFMVELDYSALRYPFVGAAFRALANERMGVARDAGAALDALIMLVRSVLNDPLMATASGAVAN